MYLEDVDFCLRAQVAGHCCLYLPDAIVYHMEAASDPMAEKDRPSDHRPQSTDRVRRQGAPRQRSPGQVNTPGIVPTGSPEIAGNS